jgi:2-polyprenyl-3-methyl-5-hydroxy-6-metoxy-1,4-benzoquinol methylase
MPDATYSKIYESSTDFDNTLLKYNFEVMRNRLRGPSVLEMGCGRGVSTALLAELFPGLHVVDASQKALELAAQFAPESVEFFVGYFEDFTPTQKYDSIVMSNILEHMENPVAVIGRARDWLTPGGALHIVVPNANSMHRHLGVAMGMLPRIDALNDRDRNLGHHRVYTKDSLLRDILAAGLSPLHVEGVMLKFLANAQMESLNAGVIEGLFKMGHQFAEYCAEIYVHASPAPIDEPVNHRRS